jgi:ABC-type branched-subunit amino acid transport system substrate-binding protein
MIGEVVPTDYTYVLDSDFNNKFVDAFIKKYEYPPDEGGAMAYGTAWAAINALKATMGDTTPDTLHEAILNLDYIDPGGPVRLDRETGFAIRDIIICEIAKKGKEFYWEPVFTYKDVPPRGY